MVLQVRPLECSLDVMFPARAFLPLELEDYLASVCRELLGHPLEAVFLLDSLPRGLALGGRHVLQHWVEPLMRSRAGVGYRDKNNRPYSRPVLARNRSDINLSGVGWRRTD